MAILLSVVTAVGAMLVAMAANNLLHANGRVLEETKTPLGARRVRLVTTAMCDTDWYRALAIGVAMGLVSYAPITVGVAFVPVLCFIISIGIFGYLMVWWKREGSEITEMVPFIILAILTCWISEGAAYATAAAFSVDSFWTTILTTIPWILLIVSIGFFLGNFFFFRAWLKEKAGEEVA